MTMFLLNLILTLVYLLLAGEASFINALLGFVIGLAILTLINLPFGKKAYITKLFHLARFALYFLRILVQANLEVAKEIVTPGYHMTPRILRYPVDDLSDVQTTVLANAITLTPGTLTADLSDDGSALYIHAMYAQDEQNAIAALDELKHRIMTEVFDG